MGWDAAKNTATESVDLPASEPNEDCLLTDVKIRQFTNEEFRSGLWKA